MTPSNRRRLLQWLTLAAAGGGAPSLHAQGAAYPTKPIRLVVGYPPGGSGDFITRVAADEIGKEIGVQVLVENRPGAGGTIANESVSKAAPDGYTLLNAGPFALTNALYRKLDDNAVAMARIRNTHPSLKNVVPTLASLLAERKK